MKRNILKLFEYEFNYPENDDHETFADFYSFNDLMDEFE